MTGPENDDDVVELLTWDASDGTEEDEEDEFEEELPADENFEPDADDESQVLDEVVADGFAKNGPAGIPQPGRAKSHPDLPRVKSTSFKRFIS